MQRALKTLTVVAFGIGLIFWGTSVRANLAQIKAYKEAYPDTKPKCINCHTDEHPKKDGAHDNNAYGLAVVKLAGKDKPTADTYTKAGKIEDSKQ